MKSYIYAMTGLMLSGALNAAELIPRDDIRLLVFNGTETKSEVEPVKLEEGFNQIVIRVEKTIGRGSNEKSFESTPFMMMFEATDKDVTVVAPKFNSYDRAKRHFKSKNAPDMKLLVDGKEIDYTYAKIQPRKGFLPYRNLEELVANYNIANGIGFGEKGDLIAGTQSVDQPVAESVEMPNLKQLQGWYLKASPEERKVFKKWIVDQD